MQSKIKSKLKKNLFTIITLMLSVGFLLYFLFTNSGISQLGHIITTLRLRWLFLAIAVTVCGWLLEGLVLHIMCRHFERKWHYRNSLMVSMVGMLYAAITPFSTGGQPMQIYTLRNMKMDTGVATSIMAVRSLLYQIVMVFYALIMVCFKLHYFQTNVSNFSFLTVIGLFTNCIFIGTVILFMVSEKLTDKILRACIHIFYKFKMCKHPEERYQKIHGHLQMFHDASKIMGNSAQLYITVMSFTAVQITMGSLIPYFIYRSFNLHGAHITTMIAAQVFVSMVSAFVPLPGSSGGAELSFSAFFGPYFTSGTLIPAILLWRIITYFANIFVGGVYVYSGNRHARKLEEIEK